MAWLSLGTRVAGFAILLPIVLADFSDAEVSVWLLFSAVASFQAILDFGFSPTFSREVAYGLAGRSTAGKGTTHAGQQDWSVVSVAVATMAWLYRRIGLATFAILATVGTAVCVGPIARVDDPAGAWLAWVAVVLTLPVAVYGNRYAAFLVGADQIALQKRWEAAVGAASLMAQAGVVLAGAGLVGLVLSAQAGLLAQVLANRALARRVAAGRIAGATSPALKRELVGALWPAAWRTASGAVLSLGVSQGVAIAMANVLVAAEAAAVQLALRVMQLISQVSQAPFYTRIPVLNRMRVAASRRALSCAAARAMRSSLWIFVAGAILVDLAARPLLAFVGSDMQFPGETFWVLLTLAVFFERFGAMHVQLLLTGNRAIAHVANGVTAVAWVAGLVLLFPTLGMLSLPVSMLVAYAGCYALLAATQSHAELATGNAWAFEAKTSLAPLLVVLLHAAFRAWA